MLDLHFSIFPIHIKDEVRLYNDNIFFISMIVCPWTDKIFPGNHRTTQKTIHPPFLHFTDSKAKKSLRVH